MGVRCEVVCCGGKVCSCVLTAAVRPYDTLIRQCFCVT